jgi:hypothetical protein
MATRYCLSPFWNMDSTRQRTCRPRPCARTWRPSATRTPFVERASRPRRNRFPSLVSLTTETDPRFQPGIEVGLAIERQKPVTAVRTRTRGARRRRCRRRRTRRRCSRPGARRSRGDLRRRCRTAGAARRRPSSRTTRRRCRTAAGRRGTRAVFQEQEGVGCHRRRRRGG